MMPDHMHGILFVKERIPVHLSQIIKGFKTGCNRLLKAARNTQPADKQQASPQAAPSSRLSPSQQFRQAASPSRLSPSQPSLPALHLFVPGYNDLILRSFDELPIWKNYLHDNPRRLLMKREHPEFLRPFFQFRLGSHTYNGIGNRALLSAPSRMNVRISRRLTPEQLEAETTRYLSAARAGTVLISPAISPGEKRVMRAAFDEGLPTVVIMENGFTPLSKPHGEQFEACADGRLLMLSAWEHHNERRTLTAYQCQQMNLMALELSQ